MNTTFYRYPLDGTGTSPDNLVIGEEHQLSNRAIRCIALTYGGFYADSVIVRDLATGLPLVHNLDYVFGELFEFPTGMYGKEIFGIIAINKPNVSAVSVDYQVLGGDFSYSMDAIIAMMDSLNLGDRPVDWGNIVNRPTAFDPASHLHDAGDIYGFEYVTHALERLRSAILVGDAASHDEIYRYIDTITDGFDVEIAALKAQALAHAADKNNPHEVTKTQVGLGNVQNYGTANQTQMNTGTATDLYTTPLVVATYVTERAITPMNTHIGRNDNPHAVTKLQVGLGSVLNFGIADLTQAVAGTSNALYMTPRTTFEAIARLAIDPLEAHTSNMMNPHNVTKSQLGLADVENYAPATDAQAIAGTNNATVMTPKNVKDAVTSWYTAGNFDSRYIRKDAAGVVSSITVINDVAFIFVAGAWRQMWPPAWQ